MSTAALASRTKASPISGNREGAEVRRPFGWREANTRNAIGDSDCRDDQIARRTLGIPVGEALDHGQREVLRCVGYACPYA